MKRSWSNLPAEILQLICKILLDDPIQYPKKKNVKVRDVVQCQLACKKWSKIAQFEIYTDITLNSVLSVQLFNRTISDNLDLGTYTKKLEFTFSQDLEKSCFDQLTTNLISLEYLRSSEPKSSFYLRLIQAHARSKLKNLKSLPRPSITAVESYLTCALVFGKTLTNLTITTDFNPEVDRISYNILCENLHQFPLLEELYIDNIDSTSNTIESFDGIVDQCQALKEISFFVCPKTNAVPTISIDKTIDLSRIVARPNINRLCGVGLLIENDKSLLYLMHKYPGLKICNINHNKTFFDVATVIKQKMLSTRNNFSFPIIARFLSYLDKISIHSLDLLFTTQNTSDILLEYSRLCDGVLKPLILIWDNSFEGTGEVAQLEMSHLHPHRGNDEDRYLGTDEDKYLGITYYTENKNSPYLKLIERCGHIIKDLSLFGLVVPSGDGNDTDNTRIANSSLNYAFKFCPNLHRMEIDNLTLMDCDTKLPISRSITYLRLSNITLTEDALNALLGKLPSLKHFSFLLFTLKGRGSSSDEYSEEEEEEDPFGKNIFCINMPSKSLETLTINNADFDAFKYELALVETEENSSYHYIKDSNDSDEGYVMIEIDAEDFNAIKEDCKILHIRCKSVDMITLDSNSWSFNISNANGCNK
jgi:hypothetical protein